MRVLLFAAAYVLIILGMLGSVIAQTNPCTDPLATCYTDSQGNLFCGYPLYDQNSNFVGGGSGTNTNEVDISFSTSNLITSLTAKAAAQVGDPESMLLPAFGSSTISVSGGGGEYWVQVNVY
jgi:hypothetical protein